ncbi:MAG: prolipoprotein diacylglyceryl transferase [Anaerolineae bacterium]|nr:MAG: prolipoprotein diacylglyceryl transferase [Anaerolineae bacterium]
MTSSFQLGPVTIHVYGIIIMVGVAAAVALIIWQAKQRGKDISFVEDGVIWVLIGGILGARLWHILTPPPSMVAAGLTTKYYLTHPLAAIAVWRGGLGIPGAILGGVFALYFYCRKRGERFAFWADLAAPGLALGQAIGRWGNFVNQELYGRPTDLPWAIYIDPAHRLPEFQQYAYYHPTFLYESLWNLMNMALLLWVGKRFRDRLQEGDVLLLYLVVYPVGRFLLEFLRLDSSQVAGINANQTLMAVVAIAAAAALFWRHRHGAPQAEKPARRRRRRR